VNGKAQSGKCVTGCSGDVRLRMIDSLVDQLIIQSIGGLASRRVETIRAAGAGTACCRIDQHKYGNCKASLGREVSVKSTGWKIRYRHRR
jgi:hypothetical protein